MQVISQVKLSTFDGGKSFNGQITVGSEYVRLHKDALKALLAAHKALGGTVRKFPARTGVVKNERAAAKYNKKVGDTFTVVDFATQTLGFDIVIGDGVGIDPKDIRLVNEFAVDAGDLDLGDVVEVKVAAKPAAPVATTAATVDADDL